MPCLYNIELMNKSLLDTDCPKYCW